MLTTVQKIGPALDLFTVKRPEWGTTEVADALGASKSSAHALLTTMADIGLLERTARARYRLGWRLLVLGRTVMLSADYREVVSLALRRTVQRWGETMHFAVYDRGCVVYVEKIEGRHALAIPTRTGVRLPAHASAVGKVLLAHRGGSAAVGELVPFTSRTIVSPARLDEELAAVRASGAAFDREEAMPGLQCVAVPVRDRDGSVVGAISLSSSRDRFERHRGAYVGAVREAGERISRQLGATDAALAPVLVEAA